MPKPFDATLKGMLEASPADWPVLLGQPRAEVELIDADVSTFSGGADKVLRVHGPAEYLLHLEFQSGPDAGLPRRAHLYNTLLENRHELPVRSVVVLLAARANLATLTGVYRRQFEGEEPYLEFRYQVLRVWQVPAEALLGGGLGILPLAPISAVSEAEVPGVVARMAARLRAEATPARARDLWTATYVLMGLRYDEAFVRGVLREVTAMEESVTYRAIVEKGRTEGLAEGLHEGAVREARKTLLLLGQKLFGAPDETVSAVVGSIEDLGRLEELSLRLLDAQGWYELLGLPPPKARRAQRRPKP